jgi:hypothetical protein
MRATTAADLLRLDARHVNIYTRVLIENGSGTMIDYSGHPSGYDFLIGWDFSKSVDDPVWSGTVRMAREHQGPTFSLVPFVETSSLNVEDDGVTYAPAVDAGRRIKVQVNYTAPGVALDPADWVTIFYGKIDRVRAHAHPMELVCRDYFAYSQDAQIEEERVYSDTTGVAVETIMQQIGDDTLGGLSPTIVTPVSPGWMIKQYRQERVRVLEAQRALAEQIGWRLDGRFTDRDVFDLMFYEPDRATTTSLYSFDKSFWEVLDPLEFGDEDVRNVGRCYFNVNGSDTVDYAEYSDSASIARFQRRYMEIIRGAQSNIDTKVEALAMITGAIKDLSLPLADNGIETRLFWPAEIGDLYTFVADDVHFTTDQTFAVVSISHSYAEGDAHTRLLTRGRPAGGYATWLAKEGLGPRQRKGAAEVRNYGLDVGNGTPINVPSGFSAAILVDEAAHNGESDDGEIHMLLEVSANTERLEVYALEDALLANLKTPEEAANRHAVTIRRPDGAIGRQPNYLFALRLPSSKDYFRRVRVVPYGFDGRRGSYIEAQAEIVDGAGGLPIPPALTSVVCSRVDQTTIQLDWATAAYVPATGAETWLMIYRDGTFISRAGASGVYAMLFPNSGTFFDTDLEPGRTYTYDVYVLDTSGKTGPVTTVEVAPDTYNVEWVGTTPFPFPDPISGAPRAYYSWDASAVAVATSAIIERSSSPGLTDTWQEVVRVPFTHLDNYYDPIYERPSYIRIRIVDGSDATLGVTQPRRYPGLGDQGIDATLEVDEVPLKRV